MPAAKDGRPRLSTPICKYLNGVTSFDDAPKHRKNAFRRAMRGRQYDHDATLSAWSWFNTGYEVGWVNGEMSAHIRTPVAKRQQKKGDSHGEVVS